MSSGSDPWQALRQFTRARIALGRSGGSLPTGPLLDFQLAHARARDAVHQPLDCLALGAALDGAGLAWLPVHSAAPDRSTYLQRPDLGRALDAPSRQALQALAAPTETPWDAVFVLADGLSPVAVQQHALPVLGLARDALLARGWRIAPVVLAVQARVALGDGIGELLGARQLAMLIGERPGLSAADSLGIYLTHTPRPGRRDAERNCISNIHPGGLDARRAAHTLVYLMTEAQRRGLTGVALKDDSEGLPWLVAEPARPLPGGA